MLRLDCVLFLSFLIGSKFLHQLRHDMLYTVVNSNAYTEENYAANLRMPTWQRNAYIIDAVIGLALVALEAALIMSYRKKKQ